VFSLGKEAFNGSHAGKAAGSKVELRYPGDYSYTWFRLKKNCEIADEQSDVAEVRMRR
jgi:hypothetical protein